MLKGDGYEEGERDTLGVEYLCPLISCCHWMAN